MSSDLDLIKMVRGAMDAGAAGISIGRNIFQHKNPQLVTATLSRIVHRNYSVDAALAFLNRGFEKEEGCALHKTGASTSLVRLKPR